jgi:cellobiose phosphorylase/cellobionic acid phosphorylase
VIEVGIGKFVNNGKGYQIDTPFTPAEWSNYLYNDGYYTEISQTLQGKSSTVKNYSKQAFTEGYRYFYILDHETGDVWNPNYIPLRKEYDSYSCTYFLNKNELVSKRNGIKVSISTFVPTEGFKEIWSISLTNETLETKSISAFSAFGLSDHGVMGGECVYDEEQDILYKYSFPYHIFYDEKEKVENDYAYTYMISNVKPFSWDGSKRRFFGGDDLGKIPAAIENEECSKVIAEAEEYCGAFQHKYDLQPGEGVTFNIMLGVAKNISEIVELKESFTAESIAEELIKAEKYWEELCGSFRIKTPDIEFNHLVNYWLKKQSVSLTRLNRGTTYCPIRNPLQDTMGYSIIDPEGAKKFMIGLLSRQQKDGFVQQWYMTDNSPAKGLCLIKHTDGPLWLVLCMAVLIHQNGDADMLNEEISYIDGGSDTVYNHLLKAIYYMGTKLGQHGLCLIGDGDWNDPINGVGRLGKGESTWSTLALIYCIKMMLQFAFRKADEKELSKLNELKNSLDNAVNTHCWDGNWYVAGFDDHGFAIGSEEDNNRVFLNAQTWAIMAGIVKGERLEKVLRSIERLETPFGPLLIDPPFMEWDARWGRISVKKAGTTENGSVYCHASMFKAFADAAREDGNALYDVIKRTLPINPENPPEKNLQLPLFVSNYYYALKNSPNFGRSSGHLGTGTVAWLLMAAVEELLGIKATIDGIYIKPCLPDKWKEAYCERKFKNAYYKISILRGEEKIKVNGVIQESKILPYGDGEVYEVEVTVN